MCACIWKMLSVCSVCVEFFFFCFSFSLCFSLLSVVLQFVMLSRKLHLLFVRWWILLLSQKSQTLKTQMQTKVWNTCRFVHRRKFLTEPSFSAVATFYVDSSDCTIHVSLLCFVWIKDFWWNRMRRWFVLWFFNCTLCR